jgi:hypothetical protein
MLHFTHYFGGLATGTQRATFAARVRKTRRIPEMEMLLMGGCLSLFGLAVVCAAFGAATRTGEPKPEPRPLTHVDLTPAATHFFAANVASPAAAYPRVPLEALLLQIENHVRLEQAAAESFIEYPTAALLHSRTISPLIQ